MSLKRLHSSTSRLSPSSESMSSFPPLPKISADLVLETFTHKSLQVDRDGSGDNQRLAALGETVLQLAMTNTLYHKRPLIKASDMPAERDELLSHENIEKWVEHYRLRDKLRFAPDVHASIQTSEESRSLFCAYVGAVFTQYGMRHITHWIGNLLDSDAVPPSPDEIGAMEEYGRDDDRPNKKVKNEPVPPEIPPPPTPAGPPPLASASHYSQVPPLPTNTMNAQQGTTFLPIFNQTCSQRKYTVEYQAEFQGPPHAGRWNIKCIVNGVVKGQGTGVSKQIAKEEAAKQGYYSMGFGAYI